MAGGDEKACKGEGIAFSKDEIRERILGIRRRLLRMEIEEKSRRIKEKLFGTHEFKGAEVILFYVSHDNEVSTEGMIKDSLKFWKKVAVPVTIKEEGKILLFELRDYERELERGAFGILEPKASLRREISPEEIELAIIPGVVFDLRGYRVGYGGGYYDRFLPNVKRSFLIGLAFEEQIVEVIPDEAHDIRVDKVITEERIIETKLSL
jgi:5-formyltetrahydrofolate cyclo-ligase